MYSVEKGTGFSGAIVGWIVGFLNGALVVNVAAAHPYVAAWTTLACMAVIPFAGEALGLLLFRREKRFLSEEVWDRLQDRDIRLRARELNWCDIAPRVLAVAVVHGNNWTAYMDAVSGEDYDQEAAEVALHGTKLTREVASSIWPDFTTRYEYQG